MKNKKNEKIYQFEVERIETDENSITEKMFKEFEICRNSGVFNMVDPRVREHLEISKVQHRYMLAHYEDLLKYFNT